MAYICLILRVLWGASFYACVALGAVGREFAHVAEFWGDRGNPDEEDMLWQAERRHDRQDAGGRPGEDHTEGADNRRSPDASKEQDSDKDVRPMG